MKVVIGIDVGGTKVAACLSDGGPGGMHLATLPTPLIIGRARLGPDAGRIGAALLAARKVNLL